MRCIPSVFLRSWKVAEYNIRPFPGTCDCDGFADTAVCAGDQHRFIGQTTEPVVRLLAVIWPLAHFAFFAGSLLGWLLERWFGSEFFGGDIGRGWHPVRSVSMAHRGTVSPNEHP